MLSICNSKELLCVFSHCESGTESEAESTCYAEEKNHSQVTEADSGPGAFTPLPRVLPQQHRETDR